MRFLIIDDRPDERELIRLKLEQEFEEIEWVEVGRPNDFEAALGDHFDVVLTDHRLNWTDGLSIVETIQVHWPGVPVIMITNSGSEEIALAGLKTGLSDYVLKENLHRLPVAVRESLEKVRLRQERAITLEQLKVSEERYRVTSELTSDYAYAARVEADGRISYEWITEAFTRITGYTREELNTPPGWSALIHPDDAAILLQRLERLISGQPVSNELRVITKKGEIRWLHDFSLPIWGEAEGRVVHIYGAAQDITIRKQAEAELRTSQMRLTNIINLSEDAIISVDESQRITLFSQGAERIFGYQAEEILGQPLEILLPAHLAKDHWRHIQNFAASPDTPRPMNEQGPILGRRKDGAGFPAEASISQFEMTGQKVMTVRLRDITQRKRLEEQFYQAQKLEAVGRLAGEIAHDFNNLLTVILGHVSLLLKNLPDAPAEVHQDLQQIQETVGRAATLTRQLLAFSRQQALQPEILSLNTIVTNLDKMLRRLIREDVELATKLEPELGQVKADPGQIEQVIMNLVVNARDAMPYGGKLTLETANVVLDQAYAREHVEVEPGPYVLLAVSDTGVGVDKQTLVRIFEPFFTTKEAGKGTGLGLATVHGIVKQSGGHISVYSEPEQGTTFKIYLPHLQAASEKQAAEPLLSELQRGCETILVVEDEALVRELVAQVLKENGYTVLTAVNGPEALSLSQKHPAPIQLLLTDVILSRMSGSELARRMALRHPQIKTLYMSGYTDDTIVRHGIMEADLAFLHKPFTVDILIRKVREVLDT